MSFRLQSVLPTIFQVILGCLDIFRFSSSICSKDNLFHGLDTTPTTTVLRPFVRDYLGELVPEQTLTHPPS